MYLSVAYLQEEIFKRCHIPLDKQVLLISGGDNLDPNQFVASYTGAGMVSEIFLPLTQLQMHCGICCHYIVGPSKLFVETPRHTLLVQFSGHCLLLITLNHFDILRVQEFE